MVDLMLAIVEEMDALPVYFQERAARKMNDVLQDTIKEMLMIEYEADRRTGKR